MPKEEYYEYLIDFRNPQTDKFIAQFEGARSIGAITLSTGERDEFGQIVDGWKVPSEIVNKTVNSTKDYEFLDFRVLIRRQGSTKWRECIFYSKKIKPSTKKMLAQLEALKEKIATER